MALFDTGCAICTAHTDVLPVQYALPVPDHCCTNHASILLHYLHCDTIPKGMRANCMFTFDLQHQHACNGGMGFSSLFPVSPLGMLRSLLKCVFKEAHSSTGESGKSYCFIKYMCKALFLSKRHVSWIIILLLVSMTEILRWWTKERSTVKSSKFC